MKQSFFLGGGGVYMKDKNECDNHSWKMIKRRRNTKRIEKQPSWNIPELLPDVDLWDELQH